MLSADGTLIDERVFTPGDHIKVDDGGSGGNYTVGVDHNMSDMYEFFEDFLSPSTNG